MIVYSFYESDARVRRYAEALAQRGDEVDVIALGENASGDFEVMEGVNLYRIQNRVANERGKLSYLTRIIKFLFRSATILAKWHLRIRYHLIHVHNPPDFLVFAALIPKLLGARIILDIHDILPEFYATKFRESQDGFLVKLMKLVEKGSIALSNHVIVSNHIWQKTLISRSVGEKKSTVILNYPNQSLFSRQLRRRKDNKFIMIYPGTLNWHQGIDIAIKAFARIKDQVPEGELHMYGGGNDQGSFERLASTLDLHDRVLFKAGVPVEKIAEAMANADLGIEPKRNYGFANEALSMKILEYMAAGIPVIASDTKVHRYYFNDSVLKFFKAGDENDLAESMLLLFKHKDLRKRFVTSASKFLNGYT